MDQSGDISRPSPRSGEADLGPTDGEPPPALALDIVRDAGDWAPFEPVEPAIECAAQAVARHGQRVAQWLVPGAALSVCIALSDDAAVAALNKSWRGKDTPTNVLSFPAPALPGEVAAHGGAAPVANRHDPRFLGPRFLGDVILAAETLQREARQMQIPPAHHLQHLVVHGLLHLLGHDHEREADAVIMEALETDILATIGVADPYAAGN